jgi:hypothetical protein
MRGGLGSHQDAPQTEHGWMFFGIFFPLPWIFGAFMRPAGSSA